LSDDHRVRLGERVDRVLAEHPEYNAILASVPALAAPVD
jgi:hypothetical protein